MSTVKDILMRLNLTFEECCGQYYDGASNMAGSKSGVATKIMSEQPKALYCHCYGHSLNLACRDAIKNITLLENTLDTVYEITKLIKINALQNVM